MTRLGLLFLAPYTLQMFTKARIAIAIIAYTLRLYLIFTWEIEYAIWCNIVKYVKPRSNNVQKLPYSYSTWFALSPKVVQQLFN